MSKYMLVCTRCSMRIRNLDAADIPARGIVCRCGNRIQPAEAKPDKLERTPTPKEGPGTELKKLLAEFGLTDMRGCGCNAKAAAMNRWGVAGCRERFDEIRQWLVQSRKKATWGETIRAAAAVVVGGFVVDPLDVEGSLLRVAIERAARQSTDTETAVHLFDSPS